MKYAINLIIFGILSLTSSTLNNYTFKTSFILKTGLFFGYSHTRTAVFENVKNTEKAEDYFKLIVRNSLLNKLKPYLVNKQIEKESSYKASADNKRTNYSDIAVGLMQVKPSCHDDLVYKYMGANQKKYFNSIEALKDRRQYLIDSLKIPKINIAVGCAIMGSHQRLQENYELALIAYYAGGSSDIYKALKKDRNALINHHYIIAVMGI